MDTSIGYANTIITKFLYSVNGESNTKWLEIGKKMRHPGADLGASGDEWFREEAERVLCNEEEEIKPSREARRSGPQSHLWGPPSC